MISISDVSLPGCMHVGRTFVEDTYGTYCTLGIDSYPEFCTSCKHYDEVKCKTVSATSCTYEPEIEPSIITDK